MNLLSKAKNLFANIFKKKRGAPEIKPQMIHVAYEPKRESTKLPIKATKAYADERQKSPRNRSRRASRRMRNIYKTLR